MIESSTCEFIWLGDICDPTLKLPSSGIAANITMPLLNSFGPLKRLINALKTVLGINFMSALGMFGGALLGLGFETIIRKFGYCPVVLATGGLSCGKTTTLRAILCALGNYRLGKYLFCDVFNNVITNTLP